MLASESRPTDQMERAIVELGGQHLQERERLHPESHRFGFDFRQRLAQLSLGAPGTTL